MDPEIVKALVAIQETNRAMLEELQGIRAEMAAERQEALTIEDLMRQFSVSYRTVKRWLQIGLPHGRQGNVVRINRADMYQWFFESGNVSLADIA